MEKCMGCGTEKDRSKLEVSPHAEEDCLTSEPIPPLFELDCQPYSFLSEEPWKRVTVCHECFHKLEPDMWISRHCWERISPAVAYEDLPDLVEE